MAATSLQPVGRPLKYQDPEELQVLIDNYFESCWSIDQDGMKTQTIPYTVTGLGLAIGLSRKQIIEYSDKDKFRNSIKEARQRCEQYAETMALTGRNQAGAIFILKNYGWKDVQQLDVNDITEYTDEELRRRANRLIASGETD